MLPSDSRLSGTVKAIREDGVVELSSSIAPEPVLLKPGAVRKVEFSTTTHSIDGDKSTLIELTNGDLLPVKVESMDEKSLSITTTDAGRFLLPREAIKSMQLGIQNQQVIYEGPSTDDEWTEMAGNDHWKNQKNGSLMSNGPAIASKKIEKLPTQFITTFKISWDGEPDFKMYLADPLLENSNQVDRYVLLFQVNNIEVKRETSDGKPPQSIIILPRISPDLSSREELKFELRVDRKSRRIELLLNDTLQAKGIDPSNEAPQANGLTLVSTAPSGSVQRISDMQVLGFHHAGKKHIAEERGDLKQDSIITHNEERWSGKLTAIRQTPQGAVLAFKGDFKTEPLELNEAEISTVFFAESSTPQATDNQTGNYALRLNNNGLLRVSSCTFSNDFITAQHRLLGALKINRKGVSALEWISKDTNKAK